MKRSAYLLALVSMVSWSFAEDDSQVDAVLNRYFERYCDYTGNMGIGFVPSHTYDFAFRQHLKQTQDRELKRLFTLQRLSRDAEIAVDDFRKGVIDLGKGYTRPMTEEERALAKERISQMLSDLSILDPNHARERKASAPLSIFDPNHTLERTASTPGRER